MTECDDLQSATYETAFHTVFLGISLYKNDFTTNMNLKLHRKVGQTSAWPTAFEKLKISQPKPELFTFS